MDVDDAPTLAGLHNRKSLTVRSLAIQRQQPCPFLAVMVKKSSTLIKMIVLQCSRPWISVMNASHSNAFDRGILGPVRDKITQASVRTGPSTLNNWKPEVNRSSAWMKGVEEVITRDDGRVRSLGGIRKEFLVDVFKRKCVTITSSRQE
jgi:hypothetical protein